MGIITNYNLFTVLTKGGFNAILSNLIYDANNKNLFYMKDDNGE